VIARNDVATFVAVAGLSRAVLRIRIRTKLSTNRENREIVRLIINLVHNIGLKVVAEGTENELRQLGCEAQGFLYSPPMSAEAAFGLLTRTGRLRAEADDTFQGLGSVNIKHRDKWPDQKREPVIRSRLHLIRDLLLLSLDLPMGSFFEQCPQLLIRLGGQFVSVQRRLGIDKHVVTVLYSQPKAVRSNRQNVYDTPRSRLTAEMENPRCLRIHLGMNRHNHPTPFGFVVLQQGCLDGLRLERKSLIAVTAFQKFAGARKWFGHWIIAERTKHVLLLAWHPYLLPAVDLACVTGMLEVSVIARMCGRKCEFEPDPVPAVRSVREDLAMERNYKMRRHMVVGVNCLVHAGRECSPPCRKTQAHWERFL